VGKGAPVSVLACADKPAPTKRTQRRSRILRTSISGTRPSNLCLLSIQVAPTEIGTANLYFYGPCILPAAPVTSLRIASRHDARQRDHRPSVDLHRRVGCSQTPVAFYPAPAVERVVAGTARARVQDSADPIRPERGGRLVLVEHLAMGRSSPEIRHAAASQAARRSLANETVAVSVPRRIGFAGASARQVRRAADASAPLRPAPAHRSAAIGRHRPHDA